jgi:hypothetical protein
MEKLFLVQVNHNSERRRMLSSDAELKISLEHVLQSFFEIWSSGDGARPLVTVHNVSGMDVLLSPREK